MNLNRTILNYNPKNANGNLFYFIFEVKRFTAQGQQLKVEIETQKQAMLLCSAEIP